jgi:Integrase zinc binding domain
MESYEKSPWFCYVYRFLREGSIPDDIPTSRLRPFYRTALDYTIDSDGVLWKSHRGILLPCILEARVPMILREAHDNGGHWGADATIAKLKRHCYWPNLSTDAQQYVRSCLPCARHGTALRGTTLHPIRAYRPFLLMGMDFIGPLRETPRKNRFILHIVDYFSRYS